MIVVTQGGILCDSVYGMFDEDNSGSMDFQENMTVILTITLSQCWWYEGKRALKEVKCIQAKFAMMMSTPEEKLSWIFEIFDSDGGGKKNCWKVTKWFAFPPLGPSSSVKQANRTWQPFVGGKNGHENFRQARIYNFCDKCVVFARNRKFNSVKYAIYTM